MPCRICGSGSFGRISAALSRRGVRSSAGIELRNLNPEAEEASDVSSVMEAPVPTVSAAPWPLLCYLRPLVADRPYACHMHACLAVGMLVIFATVLPTWLWRIYEHSFIPQYLDLHVEGGRFFFLSEMVGTPRMKNLAWIFESSSLMEKKHLETGRRWHHKTGRSGCGWR